MQFKFPDSGREVQIEGLSFLTLSLLRGHYDATYPGKPVLPVDPLDSTPDGNVSTDEFKSKNEQYKKDKDNYDKALAIWQTKVNQAKWLAVKLLYADGVKKDSIDREAVEEAVQKVAPFMDLQEAIREGYKTFGVTFREDLMVPYIYLFHVCIATTGDQLLFEDALMQGSGPTQEAVQQAQFRLRR